MSNRGAEYILPLLISAGFLGSGGYLMFRGIKGMSG